LQQKGVAYITGVLCIRNGKYSVFTRAQQKARVIWKQVYTTYRKLTRTVIFLFFTEKSVINQQIPHHYFFLTISFFSQSGEQALDTA
jgi:hypothetical protein